MTSTILKGIKILAISAFVFTNHKIWIDFDDIVRPPHVFDNTKFNPIEILYIDDNVQEDDLILMGKEENSIYNGLSMSRVCSLIEALQSAEQDEDYEVNTHYIDGKDREILEALVYGEAGGEDFVGQCLVAQCLRDTMSRMNTTDVRKVIKTFKYAGSTKNGTSQSCKDAVAFIFDNGGYVVKQRIIYFYAFEMTQSKWHETQDFVIEWGCHRFFDDSGWE